MDTSRTPSKNKKVYITKDFLNKVSYINSNINNIEWSGIAFCEVTGDFNAEDFTITPVEIYLMDIGNTATTSFSHSEDLPTYIAENPHLLSLKAFSIHSHHNMDSFMSAVDITDLKNMGEEFTHYASIVVNNKLEFHGGISYKRKITFSGTVLEEIDSYSGKITKENQTEFVKEVVEYFDLDFEIEDHTSYVELKSRIKELKKQKTNKVASLNTRESTSTYNINEPVYNYSYNGKYRPKHSSNPVKPINQVVEEEEKEIEEIKEESIPIDEIHTFVEEILSYSGEDLEMMGYYPYTLMTTTPDRNLTFDELLSEYCSYYMNTDLSPVEIETTILDRIELAIDLDMKKNKYTPGYIKAVMKALEPYKDVNQVVYSLHTNLKEWIYQ